MKKVVVVFIFTVSCVSLIAQSNIRLNNYWENTYYINPASINEDYMADFSMAARKQWAGFSGSPTTFFAAGTTYLDNIHTQFGAKISIDKIGYTSTSDIALSYAYSFPVSDKWKLHMGLALNYQSLSYDVSEVTFPTSDDPTIYDRLLSQSNFNAGIGLELTNKYWIVGASSQNVFSIFSSINQQFSNANFFYTRYRQYTHDFINLGFGVSAIQENKLLQTELNIMSYFKVTPQTDAFQVGLFYRTWNEVGLLFGINLTDNIKLSYSYDYNASGISSKSYGTHELMLSYKIDRPFQCHNCWY